MVVFDWNAEKNERLKQERGVSFEDVVVALATGRLLALQPHPNAVKYPHQKVFIVNIRDYAYLAPFVIDGDRLFLKTVVPSRKATKRFLHL